jgi:hypothetical protein
MRTRSGRSVSVPDVHPSKLSMSDVPGLTSPSTDHHFQARLHSCTVALLHRLTVTDASQPFASSPAGLLAHRRHRADSLETMVTYTV